MTTCTERTFAEVETDSFAWSADGRRALRCAAVVVANGRRGAVVAGTVEVEATRECGLDVVERAEDLPDVACALRRLLTRMGRNGHISL